MMSCGVDVSKLKGVTEDSRKVKDGYLFAAFPGVKSDGRDFIDKALEMGASYILAPHGAELPEDAKAVLIESENPRKDFATIVSEFYGAQPVCIAAVTGTNGKTSVATFAAQLWKDLGFKSVAMGTLGLHGAGFERSGSLTTPGTVTLHEALAEVKGRGVDHLALEASSHGLAQYRLDGVAVSVAAFTNLSRDHLDYHKDMDEYFAAKSRLFSEVLRVGGRAVLNADSAEFEALKVICEKRDITFISYGKKADHLRLIKAEPSALGQNLEIEGLGKTYKIQLPLAGTFQAMNALCAAGIVWASYTERLDDIIGALENLTGAPGRLQLISGHPQGAGVYVDYAHTPDALETVLKALRPHTKGKLICLFGCGGDRDTGKRPLMGEIAARLSDHVIITDDNPRSEDPASIRADIFKAAPNAEEVEGRRSAIQRAVNILSEGDVLLVAGKGHEQGQIFKDHTEPFDDAQEIASALSSLSQKS